MFLLYLSTFKGYKSKNYIIFSLNWLDKQSKENQINVNYFWLTDKIKNKQTG